MRKFTNIIENKEKKEIIADSALATLMNQRLMKKSDMKHTRIEFGYLLLVDDTEIATMFKVVIPKTNTVYYFGSKDGNLLLLNETFTELQFLQIQKNMFRMHNITDYNKKDYTLELY